MHRHSQGSSETEDAAVFALCLLPSDKTGHLVFIPASAVLLLPECSNRDEVTACSRISVSVVGVAQQEKISDVKQGGATCRRPMHRELIMSQ